LPDELLDWLEGEAKRANCQKSTLVRQILRRHRTKRTSGLERAADLCGCVQSGIPDLAHNKKYLKGFGQ